MGLIEHPGWECPTCGAWDSGSVMPRRAQWCDGACTHPKVAMERVSYVRADAYRGAVSDRDALARYLRWLMDGALGVGPMTGYEARAMVARVLGGQ